MSGDGVSSQRPPSAVSGNPAICHSQTGSFASPACAGYALERDGVNHRRITATSCRNAPTRNDSQVSKSTQIRAFRAWQVGVRLPALRWFESVNDVVSFMVLSSCRCVRLLGKMSQKVQRKSRRFSRPPARLADSAFGV